MKSFVSTALMLGAFATLFLFGYQSGRVHELEKNQKFNCVCDLNANIEPMEIK